MRAPEVVMLVGKERGRSKRETQNDAQHSNRKNMKENKQQRSFHTQNKLTNDSVRLQLRLNKGFSGPNVARKHPHNLRNRI